MHVYAAVTSVGGLLLGTKHAGKSFRDGKQRESSVCGTRAGVRSTFSATINERSHAKPLPSASNHKPAEVRLASSLTASKANKQKTKTQQADGLSARSGASSRFTTTRPLKLSEATVTRAPGRCFDIMVGPLCSTVCIVWQHFHLHNTKCLFEKRAFQCSGGKFCC